MMGLRECLLLLPMVLCLQGICSALKCSVIPGRLAVIDAGNGQVFGVTSAGQIYTLYGRSWVRVPGALTDITTGPAGVWGVTRYSTIYKMVGGTWTRTTGLLKEIDAGGSQMVAGVTRNGDIYCLSRSAAVFADGRSPLPWVHIAGKLKIYSCGPLGCWGVNSQGNIYYWHGVTPECCGGTRWQRVSGSLSMIEVGSDGSVYGVNAAGRIYRRDGITARNPVGTRWVRINTHGMGNMGGMGNKIKLVTYDLNILWALTSTGKILKCRTENPIPRFC